MQGSETWVEIAETSHFSEDHSPPLQLHAMLTQVLHFFRLHGGRLELPRVLPSLYSVMCVRFVVQSTELLELKLTAIFRK